MSNQPVTSHEFAGPSCDAAVDARAQQVAAAQFTARILGRSRGRNRRAALSFVIGLPLLIATCASIPALWRQDGNALAGNVLIYGLCVIAAVSICFMFPSRLFRSSPEIGEFVETAGVYAIGSLIDLRNKAMRTKDLSDLHEGIAAALPLLTPDNARALAPRHRSFLDAVATGTGGEATNGPLATMRFASIAALARIGDARTLRLLRRLASVSPLQAKPNPVQEAARNAVLVLEVRLAEVQSQRTLLRASSQPSVAPASLLRAAAAGAKEGPAEMLRAADREARDADAI